jgi:hypothetical protein
VKGVFKMENRNGMQDELKFFKFERSDAVAEVMVAEFARQAINYYLNEWLDDLTIDDFVADGGLKITELIGAELTEKHKIFNEANNTTELVSYLELAKGSYVVPRVIVSHGA